ncbi:hypothetical protein F511_24111 [Dorcoceras hygrometricum]|uniref:Uncharacterized protein n=1 Tax=Dorcoceras hygrometricum TaxID=472368 RepID=A0A2Z7A8E3_9LAMI|nr:hypothetical protein F511_24111 [Dorcoceras hygrometricum]
MSKTDLSAKSNRSHALAQLQNDGVQAPDLLTSPADLLTKRIRFSRYSRQPDLSRTTPFIKSYDALRNAKEKQISFKIQADLTTNQGTRSKMCVPAVAVGISWSSSASLDSVVAPLRDSAVGVLARIQLLRSDQLLDARASGNTALSSPCWDLLALMRRVVNYHSDGYHETHLIVAVYSEHVPSRLGRQNEDKAARARD